MTYPKELSKNQTQLLKGIVEEITTLEEGHSLGLQSANIDELLYALYSWRHINGLKKEYRISRESPSSIRVLRRATTVRVFRSSEDALRKGVDFVHKELLDILNREEALFRIKEALRPEEAEYAIEEWDRINGAT